MKKETVPGLQIPEDIISEILKRLPAKSLRRFCCVSKRWRTRILDPNFAEAHYLHAQTRSDASCLSFCVYHQKKHTGLTTVLASDIEGKFSSPLSMHSLDGYFPCTNIVNGLMCFIDLKRHALILFNLTTMEKLDFSCPRKEEEHIFRHSPDIPRPWYLLGFDPITKEYKLLYFVFEDDFINGHVKECYILTFGRSSSWRKIDCPQDANWSPTWGRAICVDGALYWIDAYALDIKDKKRIQYFDVREEKFHIVSDPKVVEENDPEYRVGRNLAVAFAVQRGDHSEVYDLWSLNYEEKFWVKDEVQFPERLAPITTLHVVLFGSNKKDEILLMFKPRFDDLKYHIVKYNLQTRTFRTNKMINWNLEARMGDNIRIASTFGEFTLNLQMRSDRTLEEVDYSQIPTALITNRVENILPLRSILSEGR